MASGLPCVVSNIRGNLDLINENDNGYLIEAKDVDGFARSINALALDFELRKLIGKNNVKRVLEFDNSASESCLISVYKNVM